MSSQNISFSKSELWHADTEFKNLFWVSFGTFSNRAEPSLYSSDLSQAESIQAQVLARLGARRVR